MTGTWTEELRQIATDLGPEEMQRRIADLSAYDRQDTLATAYGVDFTPSSLKAWASFASTLGTVTINRDGSIIREKSEEDKAITVARQEKYARQKAAAQDEPAK